MTNDELAAALRANLLEVEARVGQSSHPKKVRIQHALAAAHGALNVVAGILTDSEDVSANSVGGDKD